jgi:mannose-6-phosphate isomerase-like protein (cupin superfamily)
MDYKQYIVPKPWGYEYLIFENDYLGIWLLHINDGQRTSLHCHPDKKTGLIMLTGQGTVSFLSNDIPMPTYSKIMIREGVFHSTCAQARDGVDVIEIETPRNKENLVRMEDAYGRKGMRYETADKCVSKTDHELWIDYIVGERKEYANYIFSVQILTRQLLNALHEETIIVILSPVGIVTRDKKFSISKVGDTIKVKVVRVLLNDFDLIDDGVALIIEKK